MAQEEHVFPATGFALPPGRVIVSPLQFQTDATDRVRVVSVNTAAAVRLVVHLRRLNERGSIEATARVSVPNTDRTTRTDDFLLGAGALLNLTVFADQGSPKMGQTYVLVQLVRGAGAAAIVLGTLLGGYVTAVQSLGWPGSPIQSSIESGGYYRVITGTNPAPGQNVSETVPTGARWQVLALYTQLAAAAGGSARIPALQLTIGSSGVMRAPLPTSVAPGTTQDLRWIAGLPLETFVGGVNIIGGLPVGAILSAGDAIETSTANIAPGDDYIAPVYHVREWLEVDA